MSRWQCSPVRAALIGLLTTGCATYTETGAATGGLLGAATGAAIGSHSGDAGPGAIIGGALGAIGGALVGNGMDSVDERNERRIAAATTPPPDAIGTEDVIAMVRSGVSDDTIIASLRTKPVAVVSAQHVVYLHEQGVSDRVIQAMLDASRRPVRQSVVVRPRTYYYEPVYVDPGPHFSIGFGPYHHWRHHPHHCWW